MKREPPSKEELARRVSAPKPKAKAKTKAKVKPKPKDD